MEKGEAFIFQMDEHVRQLWCLLSEIKNNRLRTAIQTAGTRRQYQRYWGKHYLEQSGWMVNEVIQSNQGRYQNTRADPIDYRA